MQGKARPWAKRLAFAVIPAGVCALLFSCGWDFVPKDDVEGFLPSLVLEASQSLHVNPLSLLYFLAFAALFSVCFALREQIRLSWRDRVLFACSSLILSPAWASGMLFVAQGSQFDGMRVGRMLICFVSYLVVFYCLTFWACSIGRRARELGARIGCAGSSGSSACAPRLSRFASRHPLAIAFVCILVCWIPYLAALNPGITAPNDTLDSLQQFFGVQSFTSHMAGQLEPGFYLNNHHPVIFTLLIGSFFSAGKALGNVDAGMFAFVLCQAAFFAWSLANAACEMRARMSERWYAAAIAFFALVPSFPLMAVCLTKDILFTSFFILSLVLTVRVVGAPGLSRRAWVDVVLLAMCFACSALLRSAALYVLAAWIVIAFILVKGYERGGGRRVAVGAAVGFVCAACCVWALYPALKITPGSSGEMLAIPYNQVARFLVDHGDSTAPEDQDAVVAVLGETAADRYDFANADPVKNYRNFDATSEQQRAFFGAWAHMGVEHPGSYITALAGTSSGYFSPLISGGAAWTFSFGWLNIDTGTLIDHSQAFADIGLDVSQQGAPFEVRKEMSDTFDALNSSPVGLLWNTAVFFFVSVLCLARCVCERRRAASAVVLLVVLMGMALILAPANGQLRYGLPVISAAPVVIALAFQRTDTLRSSDRS